MIVSVDGVVMPHVVVRREDGTSGVYVEGSDVRIKLKPYVPLTPVDTVVDTRTALPLLRRERMFGAGQ